MTASAADAWNTLADGLRDAGRKLAEATAHLAAAERTDGYRALARALNNQLGRLETDTERPEFVPFNGWREKFFMDNPDCRYWITDIRDDRRYRITGNVGDSAFQSITVYSGTGVAEMQIMAQRTRHVAGAGQREGCAGGNGQLVPFFQGNRGQLTRLDRQLQHQTSRGLLGPHAFNQSGLGGLAGLQLR